MYSKWFDYTVCVITMLCGNFVLGTNFQDCLQKDSISCIQIQMYNKIKSLVNNSTIDVLNGVIKMKTKNETKKSISEINNERRFESAITVENRQKAFEAYLIGAIENLWEKRSISWNTSETAKIVFGVMPNGLTNKLTAFISQGRGKKKRMKMLIPIIIATTFLFLTFTSLAFLGIALVAKKAIMAGALSLVLSGFEGVSNLFSTQPSVHAAEIMGYQTSGDWQPSAYNQDQDLVGSYNEPAPQHQLFIGHKTG